MLLCTGAHKTCTFMRAGDFIVSLQLKCLPLGKILDSSLQRSGTIDGIGEALGDKVIAF